MLRKHQIVLVAMVASSPFLALASAAQDLSSQDQGRRPETTGSASGSPTGLPQAPVGHRQPRASDVPADTPKTDEEQTQMKRDHELDKQLWICRGCGAPP